jgi:hypothetical protein
MTSWYGTVGDWYCHGCGREYVRQREPVEDRKGGVYTGVERDGEAEQTFANHHFRRRTFAQ